MNKYVKRWQEYIGVEADGIFGPNTLRVSKEKTLAPLKEAVASSYNYIRPKRNVNELIWHCTATPEGRDFTVAQIDQWHKQRGWSGIGYHIVVYRDGSIHAGRSVNRVGAHVRGRNRNTIGAVYVGGVDSRGKAKDTRTAAQKKAMLELTKLITQDKRIKTISGHNQYAAKACPSFDVRKDELGNIPGFNKGKRNG